MLTPNQLLAPFWQAFRPFALLMLLLLLGAFVYFLLKRRWLAAAGWGLLVAGAWALGRTRRAQWLTKWPHAAGVVVGLAWWLWLSPSVLGWLIVAVSLAAAAHSAWKRYW